jgi:two-component system sensor histidine kinase TctE
MRTSNSLRRRLLLRLWVPLASLLVAGAVFAYVVAYHFASAVHDRWLLDSAMTLSTQLHPDVDTLTLNLPPKALEMFEWDSVDRIYWQVVAPPDRIVLGNAHFPAPSPSPPPGQAVYSDATIDGNPVRIVSLTVRSHSDPSRTATIQVGETKRKRAGMARDIIVALVPLQVTILLIAGALIWFGVTSSLRGLDDIARRLVGYEPHRLAPLDGVEGAPSEVRPMMRAVNSLIGKLSEAQAARQRFVANAAHQLRTPLAALQVETERALREHNPQRNREALTKVRDAVARLRRLTQQLLALTRSDASSAPTLALGDVDLPELAKHELERWADAAVERNIDLGYDGPEHDVVVRGEAQLLRELIGNLVDNAIRYGRPGGEVTLGVRESPLQIFVEDDGPGIPPAERERVLDPFYRPPGTPGDGCGLGLAIASEIAARHGARLRIVPRQPGGLRVEIEFGDEPARATESAAAA